MAKDPAPKSSVEAPQAPPLQTKPEPMVTVYAIERDPRYAGWVTIEASIPRRTLDASVGEISEALLVPAGDIEGKVRRKDREG